ncbi:MAG TPA: hypothetical protein VFN57_10205 [Thermomicrobiaceae bacterium]|nr:hypothetical protein [Thermomicrobiaceae bacterium]
MTTGSLAEEDRVPAAPEQPREPSARPRSWRGRAHAWPWLVGGTLVDLACITVFWLVFIWDVLVKRTHLIPYDLIDQHYMFQDFVQRALHTGASPLWTPNILSGYPIGADPLTQLFYPPNLLMHVLVRGTFLPYIAVEWLAGLHFLWAAVGTYFLARALTGSRPGAVLAALTYAFGSFFAWHIPHLSPITTLSWLPWILLAYERALRRRSPLWTALGAAAFGCMALAGHALSMLYVAYLVAALTLVVVLVSVRQDRRVALTAALVGGGILTLGVGLAAIQLLPSWHLSNLTDRAGLDYQAATGSSFLPSWLITVAIPNFFSHYGTAKFWASGDIAETNAYFGLLPLFLGALAVSRGRPEDRRVTALILGGALVALLAALGSQTWFYRVIYELVPGFSHVRRPGDAIAFVQFGMGLLGAYGVKVLVGAEGSGEVGQTLLRWLRWALAADLALLSGSAIALATTVGAPTQPVLSTITDGVVIAGVVLLAAYVAVRAGVDRHISMRVAAVLLVAIAAVDLGSATADKVTGAFKMAPDAYIGPTWSGNPGDPIVPMLLASQQQALPARYRMVPLNAGSIWENGPLVWTLDSTWGYSVLWPSYYQQLADAATANPSSPLFDLLNARYLMLPDTLQKLYPGISTAKFRLVRGAPPVVYEDTTPGPRTWVAGQAVRQSASGVVSYLQAHPSTLWSTVVLSEAPPPGSTVGTGSTGTTTITAYRNTRVDIRASLSAPGFVVLADTWYPGWSASIDGHPAHVYQADGAFRAVWVPSGQHQIVYRFTMPGLAHGRDLTILAAALTALLVLAGVGWAVFGISAVRRRRAGPAARRVAGRQGDAGEASGILRR